jgi:hypothetical protein
MNYEPLRGIMISALPKIMKRLRRRYEYAFANVYMKGLIFRI